MDPIHAVTFVDSHDAAQPDQALRSGLVSNRFAYAIFLLRRVSYPCDLRQNPRPPQAARFPPFELELLMEVRRRFAWRAARLDDLVSWTREGGALGFRCRGAPPAHWQRKQAHAGARQARHGTALLGVDGTVTIATMAGAEFPTGGVADGLPIPTRRRQANLTVFSW